MSDTYTRPDPPSWDQMTPDQVINVLVYELYNPVSILGNRLKRLTEDDDPLTEEEYDAIFAQMDSAVRQLSRTVVHLKRYAQQRKNNENIA